MFLPVLCEGSSFSASSPTLAVIGIGISIGTDIDIDIVIYTYISYLKGLGDGIAWF